MNKKSTLDKIFLIVNVVLFILLIRLGLKYTALQTKHYQGIGLIVIAACLAINSFMQLTTKMEITEIGIKGTFMGVTIFHKKAEIAFSDIKGVKTGALLTIQTKKGNFKVMAGNKKELAEIIKSKIN